MSDFEAPLQDIKFVLKHVADYPSIENLSAYGDADWALVEAVLEEAGKVAAEVIAPINKIGDEVGASMVDGQVVLPEGWKAAMTALAEGGWLGLNADTEYGGQGLPEILGTSVGEIWQSACLSFSLCPLLTKGAVFAICENGSEELKSRFVPKMVTGEWAGTMNLTESQAGSDLAALRSKAIPEGDHYRISGQKIFISYGDHQLTDNIIHLVLARTPDAPDGVKGISLFVVPKFLVDENGNCGQRNDVHCVSLEHKLGLHGSPTAVMSYGDDGGAVGYLVGEENNGLAYMFVMMNAARFEVGVQGLGIAERAYQQARTYAIERVQGQPINRGQGTPIIGHPDVRRMLLSMKCRIEAMRCLAYQGARYKDLSVHGETAEERQVALLRNEYLTPIIKGWLTENGTDIASSGIQVHGGTGYIEETGAAQHLRDARVLPIYEGTTGIQANDLLFRKTVRDNGAVAKMFLSEVRQTADELQHQGGWAAPLSEQLQRTLELTERVLAKLCAYGKNDMAPLARSADAYLRLSGNLLGGGLLGKSALIARQLQGNPSEDSEFMKAKIESARFYLSQILPQADANAISILNDTDALEIYQDDWF